MSLDYHTIPTIIHVVSAIHFHCYHNNVPIELTLYKDRPCLTIIKMKLPTTKTILFSTTVTSSFQRLWLFLLILILTAEQQSNNHHALAQTRDNWAYKGQIIYGDALDDLAGSSVALSADGNTLAIGAPFHDVDIDNNSDNRGHVRVWNFYDDTNNDLLDEWQTKGNELEGMAAGVRSGWSVALSKDGNTLAVGAPEIGGAGPGSVTVWYWTGLFWAIRGGNELQGLVDGDQAGWSVALSADGNTVAMGAPMHNNQFGQVVVYYWNGLSWTLQGSEIEGRLAGDQAGYSVALSADGNTVAIGAPFHQGSDGARQGAVLVWYWNGVSWSVKGNELEGFVGGDQYGWSVALSSDGDTLAVGAPFHQGEKGANQGHAVVWKWNGNDTWVRKGSDIQGFDAGALAGYSVDLSSDGDTVAVGAPGYIKGHVVVWDWKQTEWEQRDSDLYTFSEAGGSSVALSEDGNTAAGGAPTSDGPAGSQIGQVIVFEYTILPSSQPSSQPTLSVQPTPSPPSSRPTLSVQPTSSNLPSYEPTQLVCPSCDLCEIQSSCGAFDNCIWDDDLERCQSNACESCDGCGNQLACAAFPDCFWNSSIHACSPATTPQSCLDCNSCEIQSSCSAFRNCFWDSNATRCRTNVCDDCDNCQLHGYCSDFPDCYWDSTLASCKSFTCSECDGCLLQDSCGSFENCFWNTTSDSCDDVSRDGEESSQSLTTSSAGIARCASWEDCLWPLVLSAAISWLQMHIMFN